MRRDALYVLAVGAALLTLAAGCGGSGPTSPSDPAAPEPTVARTADLPANVYGAYTASGDVPEAAANGGNLVIVIPSYADDANRIADALRANGKLAILSAHHVFGNSRAWWEDGKGWEQTKRWAEPFRSLTAAVLVVDEPLHNGVPAADRDAAIARVRADGYRTMTTEWVDQAVRSARPSVDLYAVTCYFWPGPGSWSMDRCAEAYRTHPDWNLVNGQAFDAYEGAGNGSVDSQIARWAEIGRARAGVVFWVWRWDGQEGIGDNPALRSAFNRYGGR